MTAQAPPDQTVWWDAAVVAADARAVLRLDGSDVDAGRIDELVAAAGGRINDYLDRPATSPAPTPVPAVLSDAIVRVVVEMYRGKDAPPTSVDGLIAASWRPPSIDPLAGVRAQLSPYKRRWGVG